MTNALAMIFERWIPTPEALGALGARLAAPLRRGDAICLSGPLGAGKSTLARGLIRAFAGPEEEAPSPTFTLVQLYPGPRFPLAHLDLYRLRRPEEAFELGLEEALEDGAAVIEWPDRLGDALPADRLDIEIFLPSPGEADGRRVRAIPRGGWIGRSGFDWSGW